MNNIHGDELDTSAHLSDEQVEEALDGVTVEHASLTLDGVTVEVADLAQEGDTEEGQN